MHSLLLLLPFLLHLFIPSTAAITFSIPPSAQGASISHSPSFTSYSIEPAFWPEFIGNATSPNTLTLSLFNTLVARGARPMIRPGGITMDSTLFLANQSAAVSRTTGAKGAVYRTTFGPGYYQSWDLFPNGTGFVATLNFGNDSLDIAHGLALAAVRYTAPGRVVLFELGNEPTNYPASRWGNSTKEYVAQWRNWTAAIDTAVNAVVTLPKRRWFASSATTDKTALHVTPADLIPAGIDAQGNVGTYSIHSYPFSTCDPARAKLATIANVLNQTGLLSYATGEIYPSAKAALDAGSSWIIGEYNSISCSGAVNVSDTFAQALWSVSTNLIYASLNASGVYLHQGATLALQSSNQQNTAGSDGTPGFSSYDLLYPRDSSLRGKARVLPSFVGQLLAVDALQGGARVRLLDTPGGVDGDWIRAWAVYVDDQVKRMVVVNSRPWYGNATTTEAGMVEVQLPASVDKAWVKRLTADRVDEKDAAKATFAGQSFPAGQTVGAVVVEEANGSVAVRASEAVLVYFDQADAMR